MELSVGLKWSEFGSIPDGWETRSCSSLTERIMVGIVVRPAQYYVKQGVPAFRSANVRESGIDASDLVFISERSNALLSKSQVRPGDILTVRTGYPGTSAVVPPVFAGANCIDVIISRPLRTVSSEYLAAWINSPFGKTQVLRNQGGLAQQHFNVGDLRNLLVVVPPLAEQKAIAAALSDVDALLGALDRLIAKKRDLKQAAMQQLLTGQTRLPGFSGKWETKRLGDLAILYQPETISQQSFSSDGYPVYGANGIVGRYHSYNHLTPQIAISCRGNCGTVNRTLAPSWITGNAMVVNLDANRSVDHMFIYYALLNCDLSVLTTGSGIPQIVRGPLAAFRLLLAPTKSEQAAIASVLADMDAELTALEQRREKTRLLKQGMMQELLTGRTRLV